MNKKQEHEPIENIRMVCPECGEAMAQVFQEIFGRGEVKIYPGCYVKRAFRQGRHVEHMWVEIDKIDEEEGMIYGVLANDPVFCTKLDFGQDVYFPIQEIEDVCEPEPEVRH